MMNIPCKPYPVEISINNLPEIGYQGKRYSYEPKIDIAYSDEPKGHMTLILKPTIEFFYTDNKETFAAFQVSQPFIFELQDKQEDNMRFVHELLGWTIKELNKLLPKQNKIISRGVVFPTYTYENLIPKLSTIFRKDK